MLGVAECELDDVFERVDEGGYCLVVDVKVVGHLRWRLIRLEHTLADLKI